MALLGACLYTLCIVGFLIQFARHSRYHFAEDAEEQTTAEIIELFPTASITERAA